MTPTNAFISLDQICYSWLLRQNKTIHFYYKALSLASEAIRELSLTSLPLVNHKIIEKQDDETWFILPNDYTDWVSVGLRTGEFWRPVRVHNKLMPMPNTVSGSGSFGDDVDIDDSDWTNWLNPKTLETVSTFSGDFFSGNSFNATLPTTTLFNGSMFNGQQFETDGGISDGDSVVSTMKSLSDESYRNDIVSINAEKGIIVTPVGFPSNELYLVYVGIGGVDSMTHIPVIAQSTIEAYISWKYAMNKRGGLSEGRVLKEEYNEQHRILRARLNEMTTVDVLRIMDDNYGRVKF